MFNLSNSLVLLYVLLVVTIVMVGVIIAIPYLVKKGVNVEKYVTTAGDVLNKADTIIKVADDILPSNPVLNVLKTIEKYAHIGVNEAEQLYLTSKLAKDDRNAKAKEDVYAALKLLGINTTTELDTVINGAIETEVLALGHSSKTEVQGDSNNVADDNSKIDTVATDKDAELDKQKIPADTLVKTTETILEANQSGESTNTVNASTTASVQTVQPDITQNVNSQLSPQEALNQIHQIVKSVDLNN